jgi:hypothetical protein
MRLDVQDVNNCIPECVTFSKKCQPLCDGSKPVSQTMNSLFLSELVGCSENDFWRIVDCHLYSRMA